MIYGPDSTAQVTIEAAEHIRRFGALIPFSVSSPLMPALVALAAVLTGLGADRAYVCVVALVCASGALCFYWIVRRFQPSSATALWGALTYAVAPSRLSFLYGQPDGPRLLFWTLILVCLLAALRLRRGFDPRWLALLVCGLLLLIGTIPGSVTDLDALAVLELAVLLGISGWKRIWRINLVKLICTALFVAPSVWSFAIHPCLVYQPPAMPATALAWVRANSEKPRVHGPVSAQALARPHREVIDRMIQSPGRTRESLLWLRAYAAEYLISMDWEKFHPVLDCVRQEGEWCTYRIPYPNTAQAVLVSRERWQDLKPIRGPLDVEGLEAYLSWAGRPEAIDLVWHDSVSAEIRADLGPADAILVREFALPGWKAVVQDASGSNKPLEVRQDPVGFIFLDPNKTGPTLLQLAYDPGWLERLLPSPREQGPFVMGEVPIISPGGVVDAFDYTPPPFKRGALLTIFGRYFIPDQTTVFIGEARISPTYVGVNQINVQLPQQLSPGPVEIVVESGGRRSHPYRVEVIN